MLNVIWCCFFFFLSFNGDEVGGEIYITIALRQGFGVRDEGCRFPDGGALGWRNA